MKKVAILYFRIAVIAMIFLPSVSAFCQPEAHPPALVLQGSGRCHRPFKITADYYAWTLPLGRNGAWVHCSSSYHVLAHATEADWVLGVERTKQCPFSVLHLWKFYPNIDAWSLSAYESLEQMKQDHGSFEMSCGGMIDTKHVE